MSEKIIPARVKLAAKRGFVRTATQSLASVIPIAAIAIPTTGDALLGVGLAAAGAVATAVLAGAASALSIVSNGIPEDYQATSRDQVLAEFSKLDPDEQNADIQAALARANH